MVVDIGHANIGLHISCNQQMVNTQSNSGSNQNPKYGSANPDKNITANLYHYEIFL